MLPPVVGASWEGFAIETCLPRHPSVRSFYRTATGVEIDLILELGGKHGTWAFEIKRSLAPKVERGLHVALDDLQPSRTFLVNAGEDHYPKGDGIEAIGLRQMMEALAAL